MYDKMFQATGGARMGMRARASQNGKLARTEGGTDGVGGGKKHDELVATIAIKTEPASDAAAQAVVKIESKTSKKRKKGTVAAAPGAVNGAEVQARDPADETGEDVALANKTKRKRQEEGGETKAEDAEVVAKAERKRERLKAKKAKRTDRAKMCAEEGNETADVKEDGGVVVVGKKTSKKKKKRTSAKGG